MRPPQAAAPPRSAARGRRASPDTGAGGVPPRARGRGRGVPAGGRAPGTQRQHGTGDAMDAYEIDIEVEELTEVTSRDITAGGDNDGTDSSSDFI
ncbi:hypothetical protein GCM10009834_30780 [Streptomonospora arabica]